MTAAAVLVWQTEDRAGPEIIFEGESPVYRQGMDTEELLNGVYAEDERDGDVSSSLRIENVYLTGNGEHAIVVYAAKDSQNHVTKKMRTISCMTEETDIDNSTVTAAERSEESEDKNVLEELWTRIQVNGTVDSGTVGTYTVEYLVTDSEGNRSNTAVLTVHVAEMA